MLSSHCIDDSTMSYPCMNIYHLVKDSEWVTDINKIMVLTYLCLTLNTSCSLTLILRPKKYYTLCPEMAHLDSRFDLI